MATILDTLKKGTIWLEKQGISEARLNMEHLIAHSLDCERVQLYVDFDRPLSEAELDILRDFTKRRATGEPLQHIIGTVEFCGLEFLCDSRALIPRPETEELATKLIELDLPENLRILDVGCGSGVLGLSLSHLLTEKNPSVVLTDLSPDALSLAQANATKLELENITFIESDLFAAIDGTFDLIAANLPYIPDGDKPGLSPEVQQDPDTALFGGPVGTEIMNRFLTDARTYMNAGATLAIEYGIGQGNDLKSHAEACGYQEITIISDINDIERFLFATQTS